MQKPNQEHSAVKTITLYSEKLVRRVLLALVLLKRLEHRLLAIWMSVSNFVVQPLENRPSVVDISIKQRV
jgi:hypothetical protein